MIAGRFELLEPIASGATGTVWHALDHRRNEACAAKVLLQQDSGALLRFAREQGIRLEHDHLATPYGWAAEDHEVAIAMPLVRGGTLEGALADHGALSPELASTLLLQLLDALAHVHDAGWLHRDVKPANILLEPTGTGHPHLRLGDFGTAWCTDDPRLTELGLVHGTPGYLPPEAFRQQQPPSREQDLYAAGVVGIRMLEPNATTEEAIVEARARLAPTQTVPLHQILLGLTDEEPSVRRRAATRAPSLLGSTTTPGVQRTADGAVFEVFDQWAPHSPDQSTPIPKVRTDVAARGPLLLMAAGAVLLLLALLVALL